MVSEKQEWRVAPKLLVRTLPEGERGWSAGRQVSRRRRCSGIEDAIWKIKGERTIIQWEKKLRTRLTTIIISLWLWRSQPPPQKNTPRIFYRATTKRLWIFVVGVFPFICSSRPEPVTFRVPPLTLTLISAAAAAVCESEESCIISTKDCGDKRFLSVRQLLSTGIISTALCDI